MRLLRAVVVLVVLMGCSNKEDWRTHIPHPGEPLPEARPMAESNKTGEPTEKPALQALASDETVEEAPAEPQQSDPAESDRAPAPTKPESEKSTAAQGVEGTLAFLSPHPANGINPVVMQVKTTGLITTVRYQVDALWGTNVWTLGESHDPVSGFAFTHAFSEGGTRTLHALGLDANQTVIAQASLTLWIHVPAAQPPPPPSNNAGATTDPPSSGSNTESSGGCAPGEILDCDYACASAAWINDGTCDDGTSGKPDFTCPALGMDGTDCGLQAQSYCAPDELIDCKGSCAKAAWVNDGICDDGTQYKTVFTCPELGNDGTDCEGGNTTTTPSPSPPAAAAPTLGTGSSNIPYFYQLANALHPGASCQNTSIAMMLAHYGWSGTPDDITATWGKNYAQSPGGLAQVFNSYAKAMGIPQRLVAHTDGTLAGLKALLQAGKPTIAHANMTAAGHVLVVTGFQGQSYTVNDPAGQWGQQFKGGYPSGWNSTVGKGIHYPKGAFELALTSLNGWDYAPLWYHELIE